MKRINVSDIKSKVYTQFEASSTSSNLKFKVNDKTKPLLDEAIQLVVYDVLLDELGVTSGNDFPTLLLGKALNGGENEPRELVSLGDYVRALMGDDREDLSPNMVKAAEEAYNIIKSEVKKTLNVSVPISPKKNIDVFEIKKQVDHKFSILPYKADLRLPMLWTFGEWEELLLLTIKQKVLSGLGVGIERDSEQAVREGLSDLLKEKASDEVGEHVIHSFAKNLFGIIDAEVEQAFKSANVKMAGTKGAVR